MEIRKILTENDKVYEITTEPSRLSLDNGNSFIIIDNLDKETKEKIEKYWDAILLVMDDELRERVHAMGIENNIEFLKKYLELSKSDIIIG